MENVRAVVASLRTAVEFVKAVSGALPTASQLLASSNLTDVQEAISMLIYCHKFKVGPAA